MRKLTAILVVLIISSACHKVPTFPSGDNPNKQYHAEKTTENLRIELDFISENIQSWEDIEADFTLTNISEDTLTYDFSSACQNGYAINTPKERIFDSRKNVACAAVLTELKLEPDKAKTYSISPETDQKELDEGTYKLSAFLLDDNDAKISAFFKVK